MNACVALPRLLIGTVTIAFGLAACSLASTDRAHPGSGPAPPTVTTTTLQEPVTTVGPVRPQVEYDLGTVLIPTIDETFQPADPARYSQGPLDVAAAARLEPNPSGERVHLSSLGFQRGYQRVWTTTAGDVIGAAVYQFGDEPGARGYLSDGASTVIRQGAEEFSVQLEGGHGFTQMDGSSTIHTVAFARGRYFFLFFAASEHAAQTRERLLVVAATQLDRVP